MYPAFQSISAKKKAEKIQFKNQQKEGKKKRILILAKNIKKCSFVIVKGPLGNCPLPRYYKKGGPSLYTDAPL